VSTDTSVAVLVVSVALVAWIFNLVRAGRLYVGYGVIFGVAIMATATVVGLGPILGAGDILRSHIEGFIVGAAAFVIVILVYTLSQVTRWSNRVTALTQELAIRHADDSLGRDATSGPSGHPRS
jgi:hypothetical protein